MNRQEFIRSLTIGVAAVAVTPIIVSTPSKVYFTKFKITRIEYESAYPFGRNNLVDKMCKELCGAPFKEIVCEGSDYADGTLTVYPFARDGSNNRA